MLVARFIITLLCLALVHTNAAQADHENAQQKKENAELSDSTQKYVKRIVAQISTLESVLNYTFQEENEEIVNRIESFIWPLNLNDALQDLLWLYHRVIKDQEDLIVDLTHQYPRNFAVKDLGFLLNNGWLDPVEVLIMDGILAPEANRKSFLNRIENFQNLKKISLKNNFLDSIAVDIARELAKLKNLKSVDFTGSKISVEDQEAINKILGPDRVVF